MTDSAAALDLELAAPERLRAKGPDAGDYLATPGEPELQDLTAAEVDEAISRT